MSYFVEKLLAQLDKHVERKARRSARQYGRRSFLSKVGMAFAGTALMPTLPFDRSSKAFAETDEDAASCDYWRYCAIDGRLCATAGGSLTSCPPGSQASKVSWIGTCLNPTDNKNYLVSYNDCCGRAEMYNSEYCFNNEGERPGYRMGLYNDINWCMANDNKGYHCTVALVVGMADE